MKVFIPQELGVAAKFCAKEATRFSLMGVNVSVDGKGVRLSASDGIRLVDIRLMDKDSRIDRNELGKESAIVPTQAFAKAAQNCRRRPPKTDNFSIATNPEEKKENRKVRLESRNFDDVHKIETAPIDGAFPDIDGTYPKGGPNAEIVVNPQKLGEALLALAAMKTDKHATVKLRVYRRDDDDQLNNRDRNSVVIEMKTSNATIRSIVMGMSY